MTVQDVLETLQTNANESRRKSFVKAGAPETSLGVPMGVIRKLAKEIKLDQELALELWASEIPDARLLAVLLFDAKTSDKKVAIHLLETADFEQLIDELVFKFIVKLKDLEEIKEYLKNQDKELLQRAYWAIEVDKIAHSKELTKEYIDSILSDVKRDLKKSPEAIKWMINRALCEIGFRYEDYTDVCLQIGEDLGVYKEMVVSPGCTSAYAPEWIGAVIKRTPPKKRSIS